MQKRRRSKAVPKDIFGNAPKPISSKKSVLNEAPPTEAPTISAPSRLPKLENEEVTPVVQDEVPESTVEIIQSPDEEVVESQILGVSRRKSIGLQPRHEEPVEDTPANVVSDKAQELIDESKLRAKDEKQLPVESVEVVEKSNIQLTPSKPVPKPAARKFRRRKNSYQPAARAKRLDRSRHMEYKYEVRGLMVDIGVEDEHRSNVLGTMWAKGERQNSTEAKEFLESKHSEGILTEEQFKKLCDVIDRYTIRR